MKTGVDPVRDRIATLAQVNDLADGLLPQELAERARGLVDRSAVRLEHGASHTVVALAGATGSGKSSLFNAIAGAQIARSGVRRPTTSTAEAVTFGGESADGLLDWLQVSSRHIQPDPAMEGLVLLDLPDHDSFAQAHRAEVDRLVEVVDIFCWVVDPQKYADAALHDGYLKRFGGHAAVTLVVFNQIDRVPEGQRGAAVEHLGKLLVQDGLTDVRVIPASAMTGEGIDQLRSELAARVAEHRALVQRIAADVDWVAGDLTRATGARDPQPVNSVQRDRLADALAGVVGAPGLAAAAAASQKYNGNGAVGWPFIRWAAKLRPDPLRRLGLEKVKGAMSSAAGRRTNVGLDNPVAKAGVTTAVADLITGVSEGLPDGWRERLRAIADPAAPDLLDGLDQAVGSVGIAEVRPRWWRMVNGLQWLLAAVTAAGLVWLAALFVLKWFAIPDPPLWKWHGWPVPTLMALGGAALGLLVAFVARLFVNIGAARERRRVQAALTSRTREVGEQFIVAPLDGEIERMRRLRQLVGKLQKTTP